MRYQPVDFFSFNDHLLAIESTRKGGTSEGTFASLNLGAFTNDLKETVQQNKEILYSDLGINGDQIASSFQCHGNEVLNIVEPGYFEEFELGLMQKIKAQKQVPKRAPILALFLDHKQYLVAASLIFAIATGLLFFNKAEKNTISLAKVELIEIETLPDELIEAYVNNNELVAEVEWNTAIETEAAFLSKQ